MPPSPGAGPALGRAAVPSRVPSRVLPLRDRAGPDRAEKVETPRCSPRTPRRPPPDGGDGS
ncbi:hypothetical protein ACFPM0_21565 [Pseudonocardia sulfidoxydans]|uniref:hypothetical protein n=1 Tax=Pseudonocardia sulfidoxydans TaxID=54011 RepID=UPI00360D14CD